jgi:hypothetical protein
MRGGEASGTTEWCLLGARLLLLCPEKFEEILSALRDTVGVHETLGVQWKIKATLVLAELLKM